MSETEFGRRIRVSISIPRSVGLTKDQREVLRSKAKEWSQEVLEMIRAKP